MLIAPSTTPLLSAVSTRNGAMSQLDTRLHHAHTSQGISLTEAAVATHILPCYLVALEAGAYHTLPSQACARGFIRNYADYLDVPAAEMIELYHCEYGMPEPIRIVPAVTPLKRFGCITRRTCVSAETAMRRRVMCAASSRTAMGWRWARSRCSKPPADTT